MIKIYNTTQSLKMITDALDKHDKVFYTRYGDNDIMMLTGTDFYNKPLENRKYGGNKTQWSEALQKELYTAFAIKDPCYLKGVSYNWELEPGMREGLFASFNYKGALRDKLRTITKEDKFLIPVLFHYLIVFKPDIFQNFINKYIKPYKKLFIGCIDKDIVERVVGKIDYYVQTPEITAYNDINNWWPKVEEALQDKKLKVVLPNCGQSSRVIQGRLWSKDLKIRSLDLGSIFDPIAGKPTRTCWKMAGNLVKMRYP